MLRNHLSINNAVELENKFLFEQEIKSNNYTINSPLLSRFASTLDTEYALRICGRALVDQNWKDHSIDYLKIIGLRDPTSVIERIGKSKLDLNRFELLMWLFEISGNHKQLAEACSSICLSKRVEDRSFVFCLSKLLRYPFKDSSPLVYLASHLKHVEFNSIEGVTRAIYLICRFGEMGDAHKLLQQHKEQLAKAGLSNALDPFFNEAYPSTSPCTEFQNLSSIPSTKPGKPDVELVTVVWGERFIRYFNDVCVYTLLRTEGWARLIANNNVTWTIYTTEDSKPHLVCLERLTKQPNLRLRYNTSLIKRDSYGLYKRGIALEDCFRRNVSTQAASVVVSPDSIQGEGIDKLVNLCPENGAAGLSCLRVFDAPVLNASLNGGISDIYSNPESINSKLVALALSDWSHFWTRKTYLDKFARPPTRKLARTGFGRVNLQNGEGCAYVLRLNSDSMLEIARNSTWINHAFYDRYFNTLDHYIQWEWGGTPKLRLIEDSSTYFFCDMVDSNGFNRALKSWHGYPMYLYSGILQHQQSLEYRDGGDWIYKQPLMNGGFNYRDQL